MKLAFSALPKRLWWSMVILVVVVVQLSCGFPGSRSTQVSPRLLALTATLGSLLATSEPIQSTPQPTETEPTPVDTMVPIVQRYTLRDSIAIETFSAANTETSAPADILLTVPAPGGVGYEGLFCSKEYPTPTIEMAPNTIPVFTLFDGVNTCGWKDGEKVAVTVTAPDGQQTVELAVFDAVMGWGVAYMLSPKMGDLLGKYKVRFEGSSGTLEHAFVVVPPQKPDMEQIDDHQFFLHNFPSSSRVRLFAYRSNASGDLFTLSGWRELQVDNSGELLVNEQYQDSKVILVLLDAEGNEYMSSWGPTLRIAKPAGASELNCPGAPSARLSPGGTAVVSKEQQTANNLRASPSPQAAVLGLLPPGEKLVVLNTQPVCAGGYLWWNVRSDRIGMTGWTAEGSGETYWLVP